ncbi:PadR family transcriptional regulator [Paenibacillus methanolicus]|uniref:PadR family transcriptional regulator n=1 Tax=Paenibacillus methanolicus TaxID=582686 RepID=A0A5S5BXL0_9BACL|nr:helix-turn-helix transcriptional regulator [Paenibacillus methanolicus]TYP71901.1 PadR family transcriptional regulator [Paenibacillus methanolicus]
MKHPLLPLSETMHYILLSLKEPLHGYAIMQTVEQISAGTVSLAAGTLYGAVENLSKHRWIEPVPGETGRRKVYRITQEGQRILEIERSRIEHLLSLYETRDPHEKT